MAEPRPVEVEIRVTGAHGEVTIRHTQRTGPGRLAEPSDAPLKRAVDDARAWLRKDVRRG